MSGRMLALVVLVGVAGCLPVPLGDPEKSKVDASFSGVWEWRDEDGDIHLAVIRPFDERTFLVDVLSGKGGENGVITPESRDLFKAWLTGVKGETFLTMQPIEVLSALPGEKRQKYFLVAKVKIEGTVMTARGVNPDYKKLKEVGTGSELERVVTENLDDLMMYGRAIKATKWGADRVAGLEKVSGAFNPWKRE